MACVYFNGAKSPIDYRLPEETTYLALLRSKLKNVLSDTENRKVGKIEFRAPWIDTGIRVKYNYIKLKTDEDLKVMWRTYHCELTKKSIKFDVTIFSFIDNIIKMLKRPESFVNV